MISLKKILIKIFPQKPRKIPHEGERKQLKQVKSEVNSHFYCMYGQNLFQKEKEKTVPQNDQTNEIIAQKNNSIHFQATKFPE